MLQTGKVGIGHVISLFQAITLSFISRNYCKMRLNSSCKFADIMKFRWRDLVWSILSSTSTTSSINVTSSHRYVSLPQAFYEYFAINTYILNCNNGCKEDTHLISYRLSNNRMLKNKLRLNLLSTLAWLFDCLIN